MAAFLTELWLPGGRDHALLVSSPLCVLAATAEGSRKKKSEITANMDEVLPLLPALCKPFPSPVSFNTGTMGGGGGGGWGGEGVALVRRQIPTQGSQKGLGVSTLQ